MLTKKEMIDGGEGPFQENAEVNFSALMTLAAVDRIIHHASIIEIEGGSFLSKKTTSKKIMELNRPS